MTLDTPRHDKDALPSGPPQHFLDLPLELRLQIYHNTIESDAVSIKKHTRPFKGQESSRLAWQYKIRDSAMVPVVKLLLVCKQINSEVRTRVILKVPLDLSLHAVALEHNVWQIPWLVSFINSTPVIICSLDGANQLSEHLIGSHAGEGGFSCLNTREVIILDGSPFLHTLTQPESHVWDLFYPGLAYTFFQAQLYTLGFCANRLNNRGPIIKIRSRKKILSGREIELSSPNRVVVRGIRERWTELARNRIILALQLPASATFTFEYVIDQPLRPCPVVPWKAQLTYDEIISR